ncbi:hypothetical protein FRC06_003601 [Ceratobasidium sp. 370]|nr:hypothetical protein FRC06_003601 [Ceratobasidium sp. 370]
MDSKRALASARATQQKENLRPWDQAAEDSRTTGVQTREEARKVVQGYIRSCFLEAPNIKATKDGLPPGPPNDVLGPTLESFYIKWDESVHKLFNEDNHDYLMQMVKNHVKYLKRAYSWQHLPEGDPTDEVHHLNNSANRRMHTTFDHCMHVINTIPKLMTHKRLMVQLGIEGTSSDEEDPDAPGVYQVKRIKQLSLSVRELKRERTKGER